MTNERRCYSIYITVVCQYITTQLQEYMFAKYVYAKPLIKLYDLHVAGLQFLRFNFKFSFHHIALLILCLGLGTKKHLVRVRKTSCFCLKETCFSHHKHVCPRSHKKKKKKVKKYNFVATNMAEVTARSRYSSLVMLPQAQLQIAWLPVKKNIYFCWHKHRRKLSWGLLQTTRWHLASEY